MYYVCDHLSRKLNCMGKSKTSSKLVFNQIKRESSHLQIETQEEKPRFANHS